MADPFTILGVVCNIGQLIEQSIKVTIICKDLYQRGSLDENDEIEKYAESINRTNKELESELSKHAASSLTAEMQAIAKSAAATANELRIVLNNIKLSKKHGNRKLGGAFKATMRSLAKRGTIEKLRRDLERHDLTLQSIIIKNIYAKSAQAELKLRNESQIITASQQDTITKVLDGQNRHATAIVSSIEASEATVVNRLDHRDRQLNQRLDSLSLNIPASIKTSESTLISRLDTQGAQLTNNIKHYEEQLAQAHEAKQDKLRRRLLKSLAFPEMNERRNAIQRRVENFGATYRWLFKPPGPSPDYCNFVPWLTKENGIFWINGKPGSGKSTLMEFLRHNLEPGGLGYDSLKSWAGQESVQQLSFWFFRPSPNVLEKSMQGFWRSLCFQLLDKDPSLATIIREDADGTAPQSLRSSLDSCGSCERSWSDKELEVWFKYLVAHCDSHVILLIDGLDEFEGRPQGLLDAIQEISTFSPRIKICCSSRPDNPFPQFLQQCMSFRVQDFNTQDIREYCARTLVGTRAAALMESIVRGSNGVFLWAFMVARDLRDGSNRGDDNEDLRRRLIEYPRELKGLFAQILKRQDEFYVKHPKIYLSLIHFAATNVQSLSLLELTLMTRNQDEIVVNLLERQNEVYLQSLNTELARIREDVITRCAGLVEFKHTYRQPDRCWPTKLRELREVLDATATTVTFFHRSVKDFLDDNDVASNLLIRANITTAEISRRLLVAFIAYYQISPNVISSKPLIAAKLIAVEAWTDVATFAMNTFFSSLLSRATLSTPVGWFVGISESGGPLLGSQFLTISPFLSTVENMALVLSTRWRLMHYLGRKLGNVELQNRPFATTIVICEIFRYKSLITNNIDLGTKEREQWITELNIQVGLDWMEEMTLFYNFEEGRKLLSIHLPLWQHFYVASSNGRMAFKSLWKKAVAVEVLSFRTRESCFQIPLTAETLEDRAFITLSDVLKGQVVGLNNDLNDPAQLHSAVYCTEWSPRGLDRFFKLGPSDDILLRSVQKGNEVFPLEADHVAIIYQARNILSFKELGAIVAFNDSHPFTLIYDFGQIYPGEIYQRLRWIKRTYLRCVVSGRVIPDPLLSEVWKNLLRERKSRADHYVYGMDMKILSNDLKRLIKSILDCLDAAFLKEATGLIDKRTRNCIKSMLKALSNFSWNPDDKVSKIKEIIGVDYAAVETWAASKLKEIAEWDDEDARHPSNTTTGLEMKDLYHALSFKTDAKTGRKSTSWHMRFPTKDSPFRGHIPDDQPGSTANSFSVSDLPAWEPEEDSSDSSDAEDATFFDLQVD